MKKIISKIIAIVASFVLFLILACNSLQQINATSSATSTTWVIDIRTGGWSPSQDAYLPEKAAIGIGLNTPTDLFIDKNDDIYIADPGNKNIVLYNKTTRSIEKTITHIDFKTPKGIFITKDEQLYVADSTAGKIFVFLKDEFGDYKYNREFTKPSSVLFANNEFKPAKIAVDNSKNMFVIGESVLDGIIQLDENGNFLGYFATNKVKKSLKEKMQELIYSDEILDLIGSTQPPVFTNVYCDADGLIYSTTSYSAVEDYNRVKKHNTSGKSLIDPMDSGYSPTDVWAGNNGIIYASWSNGYISAYTADGDHLFEWGGQSTTNISGLFSSLVSLAVDSNNHVWCLDDKMAAVHEFVPTDYTNLIFEAFDLYYQRNYEKSIEKWQEVLSLNQVSAIAHNQLGLNYLYSQDYKTAMYHLKMAGDRKNYSQAFWEVRNIWLQTNLVWVILAFILVVIAIVVLHQLKIRKGIVVGGALTSKIANLKFIKDTKFNMTILKHPYDNFYYLKTNKKGSTLSCFIMMFIIFGIFIWNTVGKGFIFQFVQPGDVDIVALVAGFFGLIALVTICNWLISSIQDGEGTFLAVYRTVIVSLIPMAVAMVIVNLLSYVATYNEVFLLNLILYVGVGLSVITLFLGIQNVHFYSFWKTVISFLLTILMMFVIILVILLIIILSTKLYQFLEVLLKEVFR